MNRKYVEELIKLMQENPELEVLCKVDSDIVAEDGYAWWLGRINDRCKVEIDEYSTNADDCLLLKSDEDYTEWFEYFYDYEDFEDVPDDKWDEFAKEKVDKVAGWEKAIFISITTL